MSKKIILFLIAIFLVNMSVLFIYGTSENPDQSPNQTINLSELIISAQPLPPSIEIISPVNNAIINNTPIFYFKINYSQISNLKCNLSINNSIQSKTFVPSEDNNIILDKGLLNGEYTYQIICKDNNNESLQDTKTGVFSISEIFSLTIPHKIYSIGEEITLRIDSKSQNVQIIIKSPDGSSNSLPLTQGTFPKNYIIDSNKLPYPGKYSLIMTSNHLEKESKISSNFSIAKTDITFEKNTASINENLSIYINISSEIENITSLILEFGDGANDFSRSNINTNSLSGKFSHVYSTTGNFTVRLNLMIDGRHFSIEKKSINITSLYNKDTEKPKIYLVGPNDNEIIRKSDVSFSYKAEDNVKLSNCTFELFNTTGALGVLEYSKVEPNPENNRIIEIPMQNFDQGEYSWYVGCYDNSTNFEEEKRDFTIILINTASGSNNNNINNKNNSNYENYEYKGKVDETKTLIENFLEKQKSFSLSQMEAMNDLELSKDMDYYKKRISQIEIDLSNNLKFITDNSQKETRKKEILDEINSMNQDIPKSFEVTQDKEYVKNSITKDMESILTEFFQSNDKPFEKNQIKKLSEIIYNIQNNIQISTKIRQIKIEYESSKKELTMVTKKISIKNDSYKDILEVLPKKIIENKNNVIYLGGMDYKNNTRIQEFNIKELKNGSLVYYVEGLIEPKEFEESETILYKEYDIENIKITGFSILNGYESINWYYSIIVLFLLIFALYLAGYIAKKIKIAKWKKEENVNRIFKYIKEGKKAINKKELESAREKYHKIKEIYPLIPEACKKYVYKDIKEMRIFLDKKEMEGLIKEYHLAIKEKRIEDALRVYKNIKETYKKLPKKYQKTIYSRIFKK